MAQNFTEIGIGTVVTRTLLKNNFEAVASAFSGASNPRSPYPGQLYVDTSTSPWVLKIYKNAIDGWMPVTTLTIAAEPLAEFISDLDDSSDPSKGAALVGYNSTTVYAALGQLYLDLYRYKTPQDFGAVGDGVTDDTQAFIDARTYALAHNKIIRIPKGVYRLIDTFEISGYGLTIIGDGYFNTEIIIDSETLDGIHVTGHGYTLSGFKLSRTDGSISGSGIKVDPGSYGIISEVWSFDHFYGFDLGPTARSVLIESRAESNFSNGFNFATTSSNVAMQWQLTRCLAEFNDGLAYSFYATAGTAGIDTTGPVIENCASYCNSGGGFNFDGDALTSWNDIMADVFYSSFDGNHGFTIKNLGRNNQFYKYFGEYAGVSATGVDLATPASGTGAGFRIEGTCRGANTSSLTFSGICQLNSNQGFYANTNDLHVLEINNSVFQNNGSNSGATNSQGIYINDITGTTTILMSNVVSGNVGGATSQTHGLEVDSVDTANRCCLANCDFSNNTVLNISPGIRNFTATNVKGVDHIIGYNSTDSGSVVQTTNKSTAVVLNAQAGTITTHNASLGAGLSVAFWHNNSIVEETDVIIVNILASSVASASRYELRAYAQTGGNIIYVLKNNSGSPLAESVTFNFAIIKTGL